MASMGRRRTTHPDLPPRMHFNRGSYFYVSTTKPRKWTSLGKDRSEALVRWAKLEGEKVPVSVCTFGAVWERYQREIVPTKAPRTQGCNLREGARLAACFGEVELDVITPQDVKFYLTERGKTAKVRANREKALLSHVFNIAREWGITSAPNPCAGVKGHKTEGRDRYVTDGEFQAMWEAADAPLRDALDLALLTGQRPSDVLAWTRLDIRGGFLCLKQGKTKKTQRFVIEGELKAVLERCTGRARGHAVSSLHLVQMDTGGPMTYDTMNRRFCKALAAAGVEYFQFRDLRGKAGTDVDDLAHAQRLLGHKNRQMTESYIKQRAGDKVRPLR